MKIHEENVESSDIEKIKKFLLGLEFICHSQPSSRNQIYSKKENVVIIKSK
jgi:hypothetical protein